MLKWKLQIEKIEDLDIWSKLDNLSFVHFIFTLKIIKNLRWRNGIPICKKELFELKLLALIMTGSGDDFCLIFVSILTNHPFFLPEIKQGKNVLVHVLGWKKTSTSLSHDAFSTALNRLSFPLKIIASLGCCPHEQKQTFKVKNLLLSPVFGFWHPCFLI